MKKLVSSSIIFWRNPVLFIIDYFILPFFTTHWCNNRVQLFLTTATNTSTYYYFELVFKVLFSFRWERLWTRPIGSPRGLKSVGVVSFRFRDERRHPPQHPKLRLQRSTHPNNLFVYRFPHSPNFDINETLTQVQCSISLKSYRYLT